MNLDKLNLFYSKSCVYARSICKPIPYLHGEEVENFEINLRYVFLMQVNFLSEFDI